MTLSTCANCNRNGLLQGETTQANRTIAICGGNISVAGGNYCQRLVGTFYHEVIHAYDYCNKIEDGLDDFANCLCEEMRGLFYSGQCDKNAQWYKDGLAGKPAFTSQIDCLTRRTRR